MCGIAGLLDTGFENYRDLETHLRHMNKIQAHRGPDGNSTWSHDKGFLGFAHTRLSIIDLETGDQPMSDGYGNWIVFNGEIYNYLDLRKELGEDNFKTKSDTEVILHAYRKWGRDCVSHLRGMFAFAIWDETEKLLFCARDRFGIKPFYYMQNNGVFFFASEAKALMPFVDKIETSAEGLKDYFIFQFTLGDKTLFENVKQLAPAHILSIKDGSIRLDKYWEVTYNMDRERPAEYFQENVRSLFEDSIDYHLNSDVPVGAYLSGGIDSSLVSTLAKKQVEQEKFHVFNGKFNEEGYDESEYAREIAQREQFDLHELEIKPHDFIQNIEKVIYHLDYPVAGPGSFPQFMISGLASKHLKVLLGGQGGDEIFGGYARYLLAYFEQCIKGAIDGTMDQGNFIVTYESIIPNLHTLKNYKPLMKEFWSEGVFDERDRRYFKLVNRANTLEDVINWEVLEPYSAFEVFKEIFWGKNVEKESYFDTMTHFDFKTLLPALLHVEDRMSMAHGIESRVPMLDHPLIEFAATAPSNVKFKNGDLKHLLKTTFSDILPSSIINRKDKMGFPVPLSKWMQGDLFEFVCDIFSSQKAKERPYLNSKFDISTLISQEGKFSRNIWGLLSLELWQQQFHDKQQQVQDISH